MVARGPFSEYKSMLYRVDITIYHLNMRKLDATRGYLFLQFDFAEVRMTSFALCVDLRMKAEHLKIQRKRSHSPRLCPCRKILFRSTLIFGGIQVKIHDDRN
jgi:hypothetical protein